MDQCQELPPTWLCWVCTACRSLRTANSSGALHYHPMLSAVPAGLNGLDSPQAVHARSDTELVCTDWQCFSYDGTEDVYVIARMNDGGDIECLGDDGMYCWGFLYGLSECNYWRTLPDLYETVLPLVCGTMHEQVWGDTGYDIPGYWCAEMRKKCPGTATHACATMSNIPSRLTPPWSFRSLRHLPLRNGFRQ